MDLTQEDLVPFVIGLARVLVLQQMQLDALHAFLTRPGQTVHVDEAIQERYREVRKALAQGSASAFLQAFEKILPKL